MTYCSKCGYKNIEGANFCSKCGFSLGNHEEQYKIDTDCVCEGDNRNPLVPIFWGIAVILIGIWIIDQVSYSINILPNDVCGLLFLILAIAIILTGVRIATKKR